MRYHVEILVHDVQNNKFPLLKNTSAHSYEMMTIIVTACMFNTNLFGLEVVFIGNKIVLQNDVQNVNQNQRGLILEILMLRLDIRRTKC